jgi:hypothetical protein
MRPCLDQIQLFVLATLHWAILSPAVLAATAAVIELRIFLLGRRKFAKMTPAGSSREIRMPVATKFELFAVTNKKSRDDVLRAQFRDSYI